MVVLDVVLGARSHFNGGIILIHHRGRDCEEEEEERGNQLRSPDVKEAGVRFIAKALVDELEPQALQWRAIQIRARITILNVD